jgi:hypothetical protein
MVKRSTASHFFSFFLPRLPRPHLLPFLSRRPEEVSGKGVLQRSPGQLEEKFKFLKGRKSVTFSRLRGGTGLVTLSLFCTQRHVLVKFAVSDVPLLWVQKAKRQEVQRLSESEEHIFRNWPRASPGRLAKRAESAAPLGPAYLRPIISPSSAAQLLVTSLSRREDAQGVGTAGPARSCGPLRTPRPQPMGWARVREVKVQAQASPLTPLLLSLPSQPPPLATLQS